MKDEEEDEFLQGLKSQNTMEKEKLLENVLKRRANDAKGRLQHKVADKIDIEN